MLARLFTTGTEASDPLIDAARAEHFFLRVLPRNDPLAAHKLVCRALADFCARDDLDQARLRALLTLDVCVRPLLDALLANQLSGNRQLRAVRAPRWQEAFELLRALGGAHGQVLSAMGGSLLTSCREELPLALLCLFEHRRMELLLRPFVDEGSTRFAWGELHEAYKLGRSSGVLHQSFHVRRLLDSSQIETTLEREYLLVLLQDLVTAGQLPPRDAFWAARRFPRLFQSMKLEQEGVGAAEFRFGVDLENDVGPVRVGPPSPDNLRYFDTTPALKSIDAEIAALRDGSRPDEGSSLGRGRHLRLLRKLGEILKPERPTIVRRGERVPVGLRVEVVVGTARIMRALRNNPDEAIATTPVPRADSQEETFTTTGGFTEMRTSSSASNGGSRSTTSDESDAPHPPLTMVDRSDSGCRLHGPTHPLNPIIPGMLLAFRGESTAPWTLGVVRRVRKRLAGKRVEIGVEFVGRDPRRVVVVPEGVPRASDRQKPWRDDRFAAIYLPESMNFPTLPIKTMIVPSRGPRIDGRLLVRSRSTVHTIVLKEPFEEQADFLWAPFDIVDR